MSEDWNVYRTRFLVRAKQLTESLSFIDELGREHQGRPGDYIVQFSNDQVRVTPREIFEDVYVPFSPPSSQEVTVKNRPKRLLQNLPI